ncbi:hypothetical protein Dimus_001341 [Dionaea muscipula]
MRRASCRRRARSSGDNPRDGKAGETTAIPASERISIGFGDAVSSIAGETLYPSVPEGDGAGLADVISECGLWAPGISQNKGKGVAPLPLFVGKDGGVSQVVGDSAVGYQWKVVGRKQMQKQNPGGTFKTGPSCPLSVANRFGGLTDSEIVLAQTGVHTKGSFMLPDHDPRSVECLGP